MERIPKQGEFYRHFKNKLYQIITVAEHSENGEQFVVYQALYGAYKTYIRPLEMFVSEVDREKYPDVKQKFRFEQITFEELGRNGKNGSSESCESQDSDREKEIRTVDVTDEVSPNPYLVAFLEAETIEKRLEILAQMKGKVGLEEIDSICLVMDIPQSRGDLEDRLSDIRKHLETRRRYDGSRLR